MSESGKNKKILIVEDEKTLSDIYFDFFSDSGFDVVIAKDGVSALESFETEQPDIIITDMKLGGMTGVEVLMQIRQVDLNVPIIVCSSVGYEKYKKYFDKYVNAVFDKPANLDEMLKKVNSLLNKT
ncbi:MAG: response regulator [Elusimicrobia bacterium]|nr:response regulator [Elusimicrobiota bacterium]